MLAVMVALRALERTIERLGWWIAHYPNAEFRFKLESDLGYWFDKVLIYEEEFNLLVTEQDKIVIHELLLELIDRIP